MLALRALIGSHRAAFLATALLAAAWVVLAAEPAPPTFPAAAPPTASSAPRSLQQHASMIRIPGGDYPIGAPASHPLAALDAQPEHRVTLRPFRIDRNEVTNAQFAEFLNALPVTPTGTAAPGAIGPANFPEPQRRLFIGYGTDGGPALGSGPPARYPIIELDDDDAMIGLRDGRFVPVSGRDDHPVTETTWAGALAYCRWRGARLPTEAEWEAAARGASGRVYPWGDAAATPQHAVYGRRRGQLEPVGSRPLGATPEGVLDLAGSVAEWTSTLYMPYPYRADDGREDLRSGGERVTRGGDYTFDSAPERLTTWHRAGFSRRPSTGHRHIGFRCAADA